MGWLGVMLTLLGGGGNERSGGGKRGLGWSDLYSRRVRWGFVRLTEGRAVLCRGGLDTCMSFKSSHCVRTASSLARESEMQVEAAKSRC